MIYQNNMIQDNINNLVFIAIFLLHNHMLSGHKKVKIVLEMTFQNKTKSKRCDFAMQKNDSRNALLLQRKGHLFWNMLSVIWAFSKRHASESPTLS